MESDDAPYFKTVPSSPDEGELSETVIMKEEEGVADNERELRHRLMLKQKVKERTRTTSADEEELFTVQPGFQESKKKEAKNLKLREMEKEQEAKEKERAARKPIEWKVPTKSEKDRISKSKESGRNSEQSSPKRSSHFLSPKRKWEGGHKEESSRRPEKYARRDDADSRHGRHAGSQRYAVDVPSSRREAVKNYERSSTTNSTVMRKEIRVLERDTFSRSQSRGRDESSRKAPSLRDQLQKISAERDHQKHRSAATKANFRDEREAKKSSSRHRHHHRHKKDKSDDDDNVVEDSSKDHRKSNKHSSKKRRHRSSTPSSPPPKEQSKKPSDDEVKAEDISGSASSISSSLSSASSSPASSSPSVASKRSKSEETVQSVSKKADDREASPVGGSPRSGTPGSPYLDIKTAKMSPRSSVVDEEKHENAERKNKYSKFESSSEGEQDLSDVDELDDSMINDGETMKATNLLLSDDGEEKDVLNLSELEKKPFDELTEDDKSMLSPDTLIRLEAAYQKKLISMLPVYYPGISGCRKVEEFENLNKIEEGTFGVVYRAIEKRTDEVVALKRLKMENEKEGFPVTSLREINMLLKCGTHPNVVRLREIVVGSNIDKIYLVMEYVEHDLKALMDTMSKKSKKFTIGQVKTLMEQLLSGVEHMHKEYVIHRDLKTSNLLLTRNGILKIGDFGLAREYGDPLKPYTPVVVTLWYRAPELLLGVKEYSTPIDMWSVGCIFGEFLKSKPLFPGRGEPDQINRIFMEIGTPNEKIWPGYNDLPGIKKMAFVDSPFNQLKKTFVNELATDHGFELLNRLLAACPERRITAAQALRGPWFKEDPLPTDPSLFPTWPSKSDHIMRGGRPIPPSAAPQPPPPAGHPNDIEHYPSANKLKLLKELNVDVKHASRGGFSLKF